MPHNQEFFHVTVVGGGLVGKTAALALSQAGLRVALLAETAAPHADTMFDTRIYALSASSQALLERARVWQALKPERLGPVYDMRVFGDASAQLHFSAFQAAVPQLAWIAEARDIEHALDTALRFMPQLHWVPARAQSLAVSREKATLTTDSGEIIDSSLVVGADGAHSWVRAQTPARVTRRDYRQSGVVANFKTAKPHGETAFQWFDRGEIIALLPLPGPYVSLVWSAHAPHARELLAIDGAALAARVEQASGGALGALTPVTPAHGFPLSLQTLDTIIAPRVALIGDAAHLVHPLAGQGMNLGLRDVAVLVETLTHREPFRDTGDATLLRRYERARREDVLKLVAATDGLHRLFNLPGNLARGLRNAGMSLVSAQPLVKRWLVAGALG